MARGNSFSFESSRYWTRPLGRRQVLRGAGAGSLGVAALLVGCGEDEPTATSPTASIGGGSTPAASTGTATATATAATGPKEGGEIVFSAASKQSDFLTPRLSNLGKDMSPMALMGDPLIYLSSAEDGGMKMDWGLLEEFELADNTTLVGHIRPGVTFHDGSPLNAEAVKASLEMLRDEEKAPTFAYRGTISAIETMDVTDDMTLTFNLTRPDVTLLAAFGTNPGFIFSAAEVERSGDAEILKPVMTGAFIPDEVQVGVERSFVRNENYWRKTAGNPPFLAKITERDVTEVESRMAAVETGDLSFGQFRSGGTVKRIVDEGKLQARSYIGSAIGLYQNITLPPFDDIRVRQAYAHSIDKQLVLENAYLGLGNVMTGWVPPELPDYLDYQPYPYDPAEARKLLEATGLELPLKMDLHYHTNSDAALTEIYVLIYQSGMNEGGFDVTLKQLENTDLQKQMWDDLTMPLGIPTGFGPRPDAGLALSVFLSKKARFNPSRESPLATEIQTLLDQQAAEFNTEARKEIIRDIQTRALDEVYASLPVTNYNNYVIANDTVGGIDQPEFINETSGPGAVRQALLWRADL